MQSEKVRLTIECTLEERSYIKMLAAHHHKTISQFFLQMARDELAKKSKKPNKISLEAHQDALQDKATSYNSMEDLWLDIGADVAEP